MGKNSSEVSTHLLPWFLRILCSVKAIKELVIWCSGPSCCSPGRRRDGEACRAGAFSPLHAYRDSRLLARLERGTFSPEAQRCSRLSWVLCPPLPQHCAGGGRHGAGAGRCKRQVYLRQCRARVGKVGSAGAAKCVRPQELLVCG